MGEALPPVGEGGVMVATETWRMLALVGRVGTRVGVDGAGGRSVSREI